MTVRQAVEGLGDVYVGGIVVDENGVERPVNRAFGDPASIGDNLIVAAQGAGVRIRVLAVALHGGGAASARWRSAANSISGLAVLASGTQLVLPFNEHGWFQTNANEALNLNLSAAVATGVEINWIQVT